MAVETYNADFWRCYLKNEYEEFQHLYENQTIIRNAENVFDSGYDLEIHLDEGQCINSDGTVIP